MIEYASVVRYDGIVEQGRTEPLRVHVETDDGRLVDVILKLSDPHHLPIEGLTNEMLGSLLAGDLGLPTPEPFFVRISPEFIATVPDRHVATKLINACPITFASSDAGSQWRRWSSTDRLPLHAEQLALKILAFDAFIGNPDRSPINPNLLRSKSGDRLLLIDHESAFGIRMRLFPPLQPWVLGNLAPLAARGAESEHLFYPLLAGRPNLDFDSVGEGWSGLSEARFAAYDALLPDAWADARPALLDALRHFKAVQDHIQDCLSELKRILA